MTTITDVQRHVARFISVAVDGEYADRILSHAEWRKLCLRAELDVSKIYPNDDVSLEPKIYPNEDWAGYALTFNGVTQEFAENFGDRNIDVIGEDNA